MADLTPEQMRRMHDFAEQLAELASHQEDRWKVQSTDGQIFLTMTSPTAPHGLNVMRLRRQIEAQTPKKTVTVHSRPLGRARRRPLPQEGSVLLRRHRHRRPLDARHEQPQELSGGLVERAPARVADRTVNAEKPRTSYLVRGFPTMIVRRRPTLPQGPPCSTIGA
ncbi:hypothetical protein, partial [Streptomyces sp. MJM1172]|uniref:hypothetical protein n=1 Tax=Streptomyces sp. MJM1172 TaxID=1703926 RepID=UPI001A7E053B